MIHTGKRARKVRALIVLFAVILCAGCTTRVGDFTLASTKNVDLGNAQLDVKKGKRVSGEDCKFMFLFIPIGIPSVREAVDDALTKGGGNVMVDQVTYMRGWWFIIGQNCFVVEGTVLDVAKQPQ